jgi:predicted nucleotidyltransferase
MLPAELDSVLSRCLGEAGFPGVVSAYLFGSQAEGRAHRESDVDVGALVDPRTYPTEHDRFELRLRLGSCLEAALGGRKADLVVLNDAPPGLGRHIVTSGRRVHCADLDLDHAFVRDVQLRAADLEPFLRRMRRIKLAAIARR